MRHGESHYTYYRDSERESVRVARVLLERWFAEIPEEERLDLQQRLRSPMERQYRSALFELFLHHLLVHSGFQLEFHPDIDGVATHPDFLVSREGRPLFYLEAIVTGNSHRGEAEDNRKNLVYDTLNTLQSPNFFLGIRIEGAPATPPAGAKLRGELGRWLGGLDLGAIQRSFAAQRYEEISKFHWEHEGWKIIFEPIPKGEESKGNVSARPLAMVMPMAAHQLDLDVELRDAVISKNRYGTLTLPFVVAVQVVNDFRIGKDDVLNGLIGREGLVVEGPGHYRSARAPNGAWITPTGPQNRTISAVMAWSRLDPWHFASVEPIMVHNPYATNPFPNDALALTQHVVDRAQGVLVEQRGVPIGDALGLDIDWFPTD